ncbi:flagellar biosynthesis/type III secretory pathway M-ring protein FliF/YscJ [Geomicrobium halophilum]|uniref:Flagellar biosynthesis/type III secretory pathway M-ring protein FliF/YscJ n=1 Tax=Geomicrobium halophilum TaxID=549000 RepID=A0A841PX02_9BACL|nr:SA1362 family protein [Geomicrobium halophilum]MBB6448913.1 flagellar biosynthesis/type III secretory pathway M-ring protein FliF/YscJ [Geomicrobium halophilum]
MSNSIRHPVILVILLLAVIGVIYQLFTNPSGLFLTLMIAALIAAGFYFLMTKVIMPRRSGMDKNYRKALKQSKGRQKQQGKAPEERNKKKRKSHLKVVDGRKKK